MLCLCLGSIGERWKPLPIASYDFRAGMAGGVAAFLAALAIGIWAISELRRHRTPVEPGHTPLRLVTSGPFRFSRNPIYLAMLLVMAGFAVMTNSLWFVLAAVLLLLLLDRLVVRREEVVIERAFGQEYGKYRLRVRRWI